MSQKQTRRLHHAASLFFDRLPPRSQQLLRGTFRSIDTDGDGHITLPELMRWARDSSAASKPATTTGSSAASSLTKLPSFSESAIPTIFACLDADGNGSLDFEECKGLFFIGCADSHSCDGCAKLLLESAYTCVECKRIKEFGSGTWSTFNLCLSCYVNFNSPYPLASKTPKPRHRHRRMVEQVSDLANAIDDVIDQVQCDVCKEYHRSNGQGVFMQRHVQVGGGGPRKRTVCEWCVARLCYACGNHFQGPEEAASPDSWAKQLPHTCKSCRKPGVHARFAAVFSDQTLMKIQKSSVLEECRTCKAKAKDGRLMMTIAGAISKSQSQTRGATDEKSSNNNTSRGYPHAHPHSHSYGSSSFGHSVPPYSSGYGSSSFRHSVPPYHHPPPNFGSHGSFSAPPMGMYGGGNGSTPNGFTQSPYSFNNGGGMGSNTGFNPSDAINMVNNMNSNMGSNAGLSPFDLLNLVNNMGNMAGSVAGSPLNILNAVSGMGVNPLDMLNMASMCSIM